MLQYITNTQCGIPVAHQVKAVLDGGCRWIQLRMKDSTDEEIASVVAEIKPMCLEKEAFLIIDEKVDLAKELDLGGVFLGKNDMVPTKARMILGPAAVIGVYADSMDDIRFMRSFDIDYFCVGPFKTNSIGGDKPSELGLEGIRSICEKMQEDEINMAHVAVGGITLEDVIPLMEAGVNGIAVSDAIANASDLTVATKEFLKKLEPFEK